MTGQELHQLLVSKWGFSYDVQLKKIKERFFLQIMWKYLEQASFPLSETEYFEHLNAVADYLNAWGSTQQVTDYVEKTRQRPRLGKAVSIPLDLGDRTSEWIIDP
ncbi:MAG: DUF3067 family protein [Microcystaceae cyanobacterium]